MKRQWIRKGLIGIVAVGAMVAASTPITYAASIPAHGTLLAAGGNGGSPGGIFPGPGGGNNGGGNNGGGNNGGGHHSAPETPYAALFPLAIVATGWVIYRRKRLVANQ